MFGDIAEHAETGAWGSDAMPTISEEQLQTQIANIELAVRPN